jgi:hypothetical protein
VVHQGEGLALGREAPHHLLRVHARLDDLERHAAADRLGLLGHPDGAHAALAELLQELVRADLDVRGFRGDLGGDRASRCRAPLARRHAQRELAGHERFDVRARVRYFPGWLAW